MYLHEYYYCLGGALRCEWIADVHCTRTNRIRTYPQCSSPTYHLRVQIVAVQQTSRVAFARIDAASCLLDTIERMANRVALLTPLLAWTAALLAAQWPASVMASELQCGPDVRPIWCCKCTIIILVTVYAW